jgi:predicted glycoside hydrolase/deacetylase ChbG (UPF0249 family)
MQAIPMSPGSRRLIVNADDLGRSPGINRGIFEAHERGIVSSASLMVRWPAAADAVMLHRGVPSGRALGLGLHVDLGEWVCRDGRWETVYEVVNLEDRDAIHVEVARQLERFEELTGKPPGHLDSHQHVHRHEPVRGVLLACADRLGVPLRHCNRAVQYCGEFYGQTNNGQPRPQSISSAALIDILSALSPGVTELACHPGHAGELDTMYRHERSAEIRTLCDPDVRQALVAMNIELCSFDDYELTSIAADDVPRADAVEEVRA